jgi:hypothetical protein
MGKKPLTGTRIESIPERNAEGKECGADTYQRRRRQNGIC